MNRTVLVDDSSLETRIAVLEDQRLAELRVIDRDALIPGAVYRGRVERVDRSLNAAFVDIGEHLPGFLPDAGQVHQGDALLVQLDAVPVTRTKGVRLTRKILLNSPSLVLLPGQSGIRLSKKIKKQREAAVRRTGEAICPEGCGLIMRSLWQNGDVPGAGEEAGTLFATWQNIETAFLKSSTPGLVYAEPRPVRHFCEPYLSVPNTMVYVNSRESFDQLSGLQNVTLFEEQSSLLFDVYQVEKQIDRALQNRIWLKSGGYLTVDYCEAFTVYDVNSGKDDRKKAPEEKAYLIDCEAIEAILNHIRLCNIGGIILADLIDLPDGARQEELLHLARTKAGQDTQKVSVEGITSLGILQLTRKRTGLPLREIYYEPCHCCESGMQVRAFVLRDKIRREIERRILSGSRSGYEITCHRDVQAEIKKDPFFETIEFRLKDTGGRRNEYSVKAI